MKGLKKKKERKRWYKNDHNSMFRMSLKPNFTSLESLILRWREEMKRRDEEKRWREEMKRTDEEKRWGDVREEKRWRDEEM